MTAQFTDDQIDVLLRPLAKSRVAKRSIGGSQMSYLQAFDVRAHLIRMFGFGGFDIVTESCDLVYQRDVKVGRDEKDGWEVAYKAHVTLRVQGELGFQNTVAEYSEVAVGSATGSVGLGDLHDNAAKTAVSDALKRCAINLGTQFGLSLYEHGVTADIVRKIVGRDEAPDEMTPEQQTMLRESVGARPLDDKGAGVSEGDANGAAP